MLHLSGTVIYGAVFLQWRRQLQLQPAFLSSSNNVLVEVDIVYGVELIKECTYTRQQPLQFHYVCDILVKGIYFLL